MMIIIKYGGAAMISWSPNLSHRSTAFFSVLNSLPSRDHLDDSDDDDDNDDDDDVDDDEDEDETKCENMVLFAAKLFDRDVSHNFVCRRFFLGDR